MKKTHFFCLVVFFTATLFILIPELTIAQCAMCKAGASSSIEGGSSVAKGINKGILYLMALPYIIVFVIFRKKIVQFFKQKMQKTRS